MREGMVRQLLAMALVIAALLASAGTIAALSLEEIVAQARVPWVRRLVWLWWAHVVKMQHLLTLVSLADANFIRPRIVVTEVLFLWDACAGADGRPFCVLPFQFNLHDKCV
jgi:hypothetical protein